MSINETYRYHLRLGFLALFPFTTIFVVLRLQSPPSTRFIKLRAVTVAGNCITLSLVIFLVWIRVIVLNATTIGLPTALRKDCGSPGCEILSGARVCNTNRVVVWQFRPKVMQVIVERPFLLNLLCFELRNSKYTLLAKSYC